MIHTGSGRVYIGKHKLPKGKTPENDNYFGSGTIWKKIFKKHPDECVKVVIDTADTEDKINLLEKKYIKHYKDVYGEFCVNIAEGGSGGGMNGNVCSCETRIKLAESRRGKRHSEETKRKIAESRKGKRPPMSGKRQSEESKIKISMSMKGKPWSEKRRKAYESRYLQGE